MNRRTGCVALGIGWTQNFDHQSVPSASLKLHRPASYLPRRAPHVLYRSRYDLTNYSGVCVSDCFFVRVTLTSGRTSSSSTCGPRASSSWTPRVRGYRTYWSCRAFSRACSSARSGWCLTSPCASCARRRRRGTRCRRRRSSFESTREARERGGERARRARGLRDS